jgi:membrane protein implicated in regulation of membrane protease activity
MQSNLFMFAMLALYGLSCSVALVTGGGLMVTVVTPILVPFILLPLIWRWIKGPEDTPEDELSKAKEKESVAMKLLEATDKEKDGIIQMK